MILTPEPQVSCLEIYLPDAFDSSGVWTLAMTFFQDGNLLPILDFFEQKLLPVLSNRDVSWAAQTQADQDENQQDASRHDPGQDLETAVLPLAQTLDPLGSRTTTASPYRREQ